MQGRGEIIEELGELLIPVIIPCSAAVVLTAIETMVIGKLGLGAILYDLLALSLGWGFALSPYTTGGAMAKDLPMSIFFDTLATVCIMMVIFLVPVCLVYGAMWLIGIAPDISIP